jgi:hypothetical protein
MRNAVGFPEPGGPSTARYGAKGSFSGNQLLNTKAVNPAAPEGRTTPYPKRAGPQQVCDVNLHEEPQIAAVALRRAQITRSELSSVCGPTHPYILGSLLRPMRASVRFRASSLFSSPCWAPRQDHSRVRGPIPFPLSTFRQPCCCFPALQGNSFGLSSLLSANAIFQRTLWNQCAQCAQLSPILSTLGSPHSCVS